MRWRICAQRLWICIYIWQHPCGAKNRVLTHLCYHILGVVGSHSGWLQPLYERVLWHNIGSVLGSVRLVIRLQMEPDTRRGKPQKTPFRSWLRSTSEMWIAIWLSSSWLRRKALFRPSFRSTFRKWTDKSTFSGSAGLVGKMFAHPVGVDCTP